MGEKFSEQTYPRSRHIVMKMFQLCMLWNKNIEREILWFLNAPFHSLDVLLDRVTFHAKFARNSFLIADFIQKKNQPVSFEKPYIW